jgi:urease accessory protein
MSTTTTTTSTSGSLRLRVEERGGRSALVRVEGHVPYAARPAPARDGWARAVLVQTIAGPLAGDRTVVEVDIGAGAALELGTNAATLAYPAASAARHELRVRLGEDARFAWRPEPLILAAGCDLEARVELELAPGAAAFTREVVILGRAGETPGSYHLTLRCELDGEPLLHEAVEIGDVHGSGAVLAGARAFASLALLGAEGSGGLELAGPGRVLRALAASTADLDFAATEADWLAALR